MSLATVISMAEALLSNDRLAGRLDGGTLELYDGAKPAGPATAITSQNKIATITLATPAFGASAANGSASADAALAAVASAVINATGTPTWGRWKRSAGNGSTAVMDVTAGGAGNNIVVTPTTLTVGGPLTVAYTLSTPVAGS